MPWLLVSTFETMPVLTLVIATVVPAITAPVESVTTPVTVAVVVCAWHIAATKNRIATTAR
jgi:hypothetical protein